MRDYAAFAVRRSSKTRLGETEGATMPRSCSICHDRQKAAINRAIREGGSKNRIAERFAVSAAAVQRHKNGCLGITTTREATAPAVDAFTSDSSARFDSEAPITRPADLLDRLRSLFRLGELLEEAYSRRDVDAVVKLAKEYRAAAESYARIAGWLTEGATVNVDARRQSMAVLANVTEDDLRALLASVGRADHVTENGVFSADSAPRSPAVRLTGGAR